MSTLNLREVLYHIAIEVIPTGLRPTYGQGNFGVVDWETQAHLISCAESSLHKFIGENMSNQSYRGPIEKVEWHYQDP